MKKNITITDIEDIKTQADMIYGLSTICLIYLDCIQQDEQLKDAIKCLTNESSRLQDNCDILLEKYCNSRNTISSL